MPERERSVGRHPRLFQLVAAMTIVGMAFGFRAVSADSKSSPSSIALVGGKIVTLDGQGTIDGGTVVVCGDEIVAVGKDIDVPEDAQRIDAKGLTITPGLIDVRSSLWLTAASARQTANDGSLDVLDGVDPFSPDWHEVTRQGVTAVYIQPGSTGNLGGAGSVLAVQPGSSVEELTIEKQAGVQASLGLSSSSRNSRQRYTQYERLKKLLDGAEQYKEQWEKYEAYQKKKKAEEQAAKKKKQKSTSSSAGKAGRGGRGGKGRAPKPKEDAKKGPDKRAEDPEKKDDSEKPKSDDQKKSGEAQKKAPPKKEQPPKKPDRDPVKDLLVRVLKRELPLRVEVHRADDALNALKLSADFKVRMVLEGLADLGVAADKVLEKRVPLVLGPMLETGTVPSYRRDRPHDWHRHYLTHDAHWALGTFGGSSRASRLLRVQAAAAVAKGFPPDRVLAAITKHAAEVAGVGQRLGTIRKGKRADLVGFAGHPLDPSAPVAVVLSGGKVIYERTEAEPVDHGSIAHNGQQIDGPLPDRYGIRTNRFLTDEGQFAARLLVIANGKVSRIESHDADVGGLKVIDVGDLVLSPGLVSAHSSLGVAATIDERAEAHTSHIAAADAFDPESRMARRFVAGGVLRVAFAPGSRNVLAGQVGCVRLGSQELLHNCNMAAKLVFASSARSSFRFPSSLSGQLQLARQFLDCELPPTRLYLPPTVAQLLDRQQRELVQSLLAGKQIALIHAETDAEIRAACDLAGQYKLTAALINPRQLEPFVERLKELGLGVIARPVNAADYSWYAADLASASQCGVTVAFGADDAHSLRMTAALTVAAGMSPQAALRGLTTEGARLCGMDASVRGLVTGSPADFVIWNGSPLNMCAKPLYVVVDGQLIETD